MSNPKYTKAGTLKFSEVGRKLRESRQRLLESEAVIFDGDRSSRLADSVRAWKVWSVCVELTASWSKGSDRVHVATIANLAGLRADKVSPILTAFAEEGVFGWVKDSGKRSAGILSLPSLKPVESKPQPKRERKPEPEPEPDPIEAAPTPEPEQDRTDPELTDTVCHKHGAEMSWSGSDKLWICVKCQTEQTVAASKRERARERDEQGREARRRRNIAMYGSVVPPFGGSHESDKERPRG